jgi:hypothetical protein
MKCFQRLRGLLNLIIPKHKYYLITNVFCTLDDPNQFDVIKICMECGGKETLSMDKETLLEVVKKFPNAFDERLRGYLQTWMR